MDDSSAPLADYFWIAGVESISYQDLPLPPSAGQVEDTINEDGEPEPDDPAAASPASKTYARHSRQNSNNRLSKASFTNSIHTLEEMDGNTRSNRSSATIRPNPHPGAAGPEGLLLENFDFDKALVKFAAERENFLDDLSFSAGAKTQSRPPMVNPRAERIKADEVQSGRLSPLKGIRGSIRGSIRRKISFRDMNSVRKQPSTPRPGMAPFHDLGTGSSSSDDLVPGLPAELFEHNC